MGKTTAEQECAHVVKHGIRLLLLGIPPKLIFLTMAMEKHQALQAYVSRAATVFNELKKPYVASLDCMALTKHGKLCLNTI